MTVKKAVKKKATKRVAKSRVRKPVTERSKKAKPITGLDGPITRGGQLHFSPKDLLLFRLSEAELANAHQAVRLKANEREKARVDYEAVENQLRVEQKAFARHGQEKNAAHLALKEKIAAAYDIDFNHMTYDDQSGRIHIHDKPVS